MALADTVVRLEIQKRFKNCFHAFSYTGPACVGGESVAKAEIRLAEAVSRAPKQLLFSTPWTVSVEARCVQRSAVETEEMDLALRGS